MLPFTSYVMAGFPVVVSEPRPSNSKLILPRQHYEYDKGTELVWSLCILNNYGIMHTQMNSLERFHCNVTFHILSNTAHNMMCTML